MTKSVVSYRKWITIVKVTGLILSGWLGGDKTCSVFSLTGFTYFMEGLRHNEGTCL